MPTITQEHGRRPIGRRRRRRWLAVALVIAALGSLLGLAPGGTVAPAGAVSPRPVLFVCGFGCEQQHYAGFELWLRSKGYAVYSVSLARHAPLGALAYPGTASNGDDTFFDLARDSSDLVELTVAVIQSRHPGQKIDMVGFSEGILPIRHYVQTSTAGTGHVGAVVSVDGINQGITLGFFPGLTCRVADIPACEEFVYLSTPGNTRWLRELNCVSVACDPTPGAVAYYHLYTPPGAGLPSTIPGDGVQNRGTNQECPALTVPHAEFIDYPVGRQLIEAALERRSLDLGAPDCTTPGA